MSTSPIIAAQILPNWQNDTAAFTLSFNDSFGHQVPVGSYNSSTGLWTAQGPVTDSSSAPASHFDSGIHSYGVQLTGTYSTAAISIPTGTNICLNAATDCFSWNGTAFDFSAQPIKFAAAKITGAVTLTNLAISPTAPTLSGFCTSPTVVASNGTLAFEINVGTACAASVGTITLPAATTGWTCTAHNVTSPATSVIEQSSMTTTTAVLQNYVRTTGVAGNFPSSSVVSVSCVAF